MTAVCHWPVIFEAKDRTSADWTAMTSLPTGSQKGRRYRTRRVFVPAGFDSVSVIQLEMGWLFAAAPLFAGWLAANERVVSLGVAWLAAVIASVVFDLHDELWPAALTL